MRKLIPAMATLAFAAAPVLAQIAPPAQQPAAQQPSVTVSEPYPTSQAPSSATPSAPADAQPAPQAQQPQPAGLSGPILVLPFSQIGEGNYKWLGPAVQRDIESDLMRQTRARVLAPSDAPVAHDAAEALAAGKNAGAAIVIYGHFQSAGADLRFIGQVIDVATGNAIGGLKSTGAVTNLFRLEDALSDQVIGVLPRNVVIVQNSAQPGPYQPGQGEAAAPSQQYDSYTPPAYRYPDTYAPAVNYYPSAGYSGYSYPSYGYGYPLYDYGYPYYYGSSLFFSTPFFFDRHHDRDHDRDFHHDRDFGRSGFDRSGFSRSNFSSGRVSGGFRTGSGFRVSGGFGSSSGFRTSGGFRSSGGFHGSAAFSSGGAMRSGGGFSGGGGAGHGGGGHR